MKKYVLISIALILLLGKTGIAQFVTKSKKNPAAFILIAWNEDTIHSYQFAVTRDKMFYLTIKLNDSGKIEKYYSGAISKRSSLDTLFLNYHKNLKPPGFESYVLREISGSYAILLMENGIRIFMRLQRLRHRTF